MKIIYENYGVKNYMKEGHRSYRRKKISGLYGSRTLDLFGTGAALCQLPTNGPLALRGHVTNASFKQWVQPRPQGFSLGTRLQWVGISLMPEIDRAQRNYLTPEIWEETPLREIFYGTLIFRQSSMICIGRHIGGHTLALQHGGQNYFMVISCEMFYSYAQMCSKRHHIIVSKFSLKFKCKICIQKEVIHNFKNHILVTWLATNLLILRKWCGFEKPNHYYFV